MIFCLIFSFVLICNKFTDINGVRNIINTATDLVLDGRIRAEKVNVYYKYQRADTLLRCTSLCINDNNCLMSTFLKPFELCYFYSDTDYKSNLVAEYGSSFIKKNSIGTGYLFVFFKLIIKFIKINSTLELQNADTDINSNEEKRSNFIKYFNRM